MDTSPTMTEAGIDGEVEKLLAQAEGEARLDAEKVMAGVAAPPPERWKSKSDLITNNGQPLPERIRVWRSQSGREAFLPTAQIRYHMKKRHANGKPVFVSTPPEGVFAQPIDQTCDICEKRDIHKIFFSVYDYEGHMETVHPREWQSKIRELERNERQEERELLRTLIARGAEKSVPVGEIIQCEQCEYRGTKRQVQGHVMGSHRKVTA